MRNVIDKLRQFIMKEFLVLFAGFFLFVAASALPVEPVDIANNAANVTFTNGVGFGGSTIGGRGGSVWNINDPWALRDSLNTMVPRIIYISGRIDLTHLFVRPPGVSIPVGAYKTIIGIGRNAEIIGGGFALRNTQQIIIQNIRFYNALSYAGGEQPNGNGGIIGQQPGPYSLIDNIEVFGSQFVWIDHCEFADDPWNANATPENQRRHDGLLDIVQAANWISVSNSIFRNHNFVSLVGNDDNNAANDRGRLKVTWYLNWFRGVQRQPRVRYGEVHMLNNLYTDVRDYGIGVGVDARVYAERNVFINLRRSWVRISNSNQVAGRLFNFNNMLINSRHESNIPAQVGWEPRQYYSYTPLAAADVEAYVRNNAGPR